MLRKTDLHIGMKLMKLCRIPTEWIVYKLLYKDTQTAMSQETVEKFYETMCSLSSELSITDPCKYRRVCTVKDIDT